MKVENKTKVQFIKDSEKMRQRITEVKTTEGLQKSSNQENELWYMSILSPEDNSGKIELAEILDVPTVQVVMDNFYELAHIPMSIIDLKGKVLAGVGWQDICVKFHRIHPETCKNCIESDTKLTAGISAGESKLYKCKNKMWDAATPIMMCNEHVGNVFCGQFFFDDEPIDYEMFRSQARKYGFPEEGYIAALESVPRLSRKKLDMGMAFCEKVAQMFSQLSYSRITLARSLAKRDILLNSLQAQEDLGDRFLDNIKIQVLPYLEKLKKTSLDEVQKDLIKTTESHLDKISSPFVQKLSSRYLNLTKTELQIAVLVKEGKTSKEIAHILNSKKRVIEFHRENIRAKLGLKNKKGSLVTLLQSFS
ncbi:PocR ligand-binding domain-containing protein [Syntrophus gentianae]|nr:PocR ligand-binding domain-containing protein [Syntrophus gentianae]